MIETQYKEVIEFAPIVVVILMFIWQNNVFVRPEQLEKKHREIIDEVDKKIDFQNEKISGKYVEINAYKEFQAHIYSRLDEVNDGINDVKSILMRRRKGDYTNENE